MQNQILKIGLFVGFVFVLVVLSFLYVNFSKKDDITAESQQGEPTFEPKSPWHTNNPDINFVNSLGGLANETLLAAHSLSNCYFIIFKSSSTEGDFKHVKTDGLLVAIISKTGIITNIKNLGDCTYTDSVVFGNKIMLAVSTTQDDFLVSIDSGLNITKTTFTSIKNLATSDALYIFSSHAIVTHPSTQTYSFEGEIIDIFENSDQITFWTKHNKDVFKYTLANKTLSLNLQFLDVSFIKIALNGEILITQNLSEVIITKISGSDVLFATAIPTTSNSIEILLVDVGYTVLIKDSVNYIYFLCMHGDIISKTPTNVFANEHQNQLISLSTVISFVILQDIYTLIPTISIFGDVSPQKIILTNNFLFIQTYSSTLDFVGAQGASDIFIFSLKL